VDYLFINVSEIENFRNSKSKLFVVSEIEDFRNSKNTLFIFIVTVIKIKKKSSLIEIEDTG